MDIISFPFKYGQIFEKEGIYFKKVKKDKGHNCELCCFNENEDMCNSLKIKCKETVFEDVNIDNVDISNVISLPIQFGQIIKIENDFYEVVEDYCSCENCAFVNNSSNFCSDLEIPCTSAIFKKIKLNEYEKIFLTESD